MFLKFHDTTGKTKDGPYLMGPKEAIDESGRENVVQIVTNSASNNVLAGGLIEDEYPTTFGLHIMCIASTSYVKISTTFLSWKTCN